MPRYRWPAPLLTVFGWLGEKCGLAVRPVLAGGKLGRGLAVAAHAEPSDAGLEGSQAALDAAHLLLDGGEIRHAFHRSPESLVYEPLELSQPIRDLRQLLDPPSRALRRGAQHLDTAIHRGSDVLEGGLTVADDVAQHGQRQETALPPFFL